MEKIDVIVVGGGIIGTSACFFLSKKGVDVALFERSGIGRQASGSTAGTMSIQNKKIELIPLVEESHRIWSQYQEELGEEIEFRQPGGLRVAEDDKQVEKLRESIVQQKKLGIKVELLFSEELSTFAPYLGTSIIGASFCDKDARSNPLTASMILARAAQSHGAVIHEYEPVQSIKVEGNNRFVVQTPKRQYKCASLLNSAGIWSKDIFSMIGLDFPITLDTMQVMITEQSPPIFPHIITHVEGNLTLKQVDSGNVVIGGGWKGVGNAKKNIKMVSYDSMKGNIQYACRAIPALRSLNLIRCWAGLEGRSPDLLPLLGELKAFPGFYSASCAKGGHTLGPLLGRTLAELIVEGRSQIPLEEFDVNRFAPT